MHVLRMHVLYICIYVCMDVYMHVWMYISYMYVWMYICMYGCIYARTHLNTYVRRSNTQYGSTGHLSIQQLQTWLCIRHALYGLDAPYQPVAATYIISCTPVTPFLFMIVHFLYKNSYFIIIYNTTYVMI